MTISGIYSDLTNGGKTAKANFSVENQETIWIIIPITLRAGSSHQDLADSYQDRYSFAKFSDVESYSEQIFGSTIQMMAAVSWWAFAGTIFLVFLITGLFIRMLFVKDLGQTALLKALGFSNREIQGQYMISSAMILLISLLLGNILVLTFGNHLGAAILSFIGIAGVSFIQNPLFNLILAPFILVLTTLLATKLAISDLGHLNISQLLKEDS